MEAKVKENKIFLSVITPEEKVFTGDVDFISLPAKSGSMGVLPGHIPTVARLKTGILKIINDGTTTYIGVCRGYFEIMGRKAYVLTERAIITDAENLEKTVLELKKKHDITQEITEDTKKVLQAIAGLKHL